VSSYALLGACWLVGKCEGEVRDEAYRLIPYLSIALLIFVAVVFAYAPGGKSCGHEAMARAAVFIHFPRHRRPCHDRARRERSPPSGRCALRHGGSHFHRGTQLAISFRPYMVPFAITVADAAAPHASLTFMFWGEGLFVFPLMLLYTVISLSVFRGKFGRTPDHY
jgi:cytochrome bd ubiquinol oxidase subunit II